MRKMAVAKQFQVSAFFFKRIISGFNYNFSDNYQIFIHKFLAHTLEQFLASTIHNKSLTRLTYIYIVNNRNLTKCFLYLQYYFSFDWPLHPLYQINLKLSTQPHITQHTLNQYTIKLGHHILCLLITTCVFTKNRDIILFTIKKEFNHYAYINSHSLIMCAVCIRKTTFM